MELSSPSSLPFLLLFLPFLLFLLLLLPFLLFLLLFFFFFFSFSLSPRQENCHHSVREQKFLCGSVGSRERREQEEVLACFASGITVLGKH